MNPLLTNIVRRNVLKYRKDKNATKEEYSAYVLAKNYRDLKIIIRRDIRDCMLIVTGIFSPAFGFKGFLLTNQFIDGGTTGISLLLAAYTKVPLGFLLIFVNAPFIMLGYNIIDRKFNEARPYLEKSMKETLILNDLESIQKSDQGLYKLDSIGNNNKQAFENYGMYILYRYRILNEESKNNGNEIPHHIINKIFQPFFTTKPTGQGTGLGLSLSYDIIKAHGGELTVVTKEKEGLPNSNSDGERGTTFTIQLPI